MTLRTRASIVLQSGKGDLGPTAVPQRGKKWGYFVKLKQLFPLKSKALAAFRISVHVLFKLGALNSPHRGLLMGIRVSALRPMGLLLKTLALGKLYVLYLKQAKAKLQGYTFAIHYAFLRQLFATHYAFAWQTFTTHYAFVRQTFTTHYAFVRQTFTNHYAFVRQTLTTHYAFVRQTHPTD